MMQLLFPLLAFLISVLAYWQPALLATWKPAIVPLLGVVMFTMGIGLGPADFRRILLRPAVMGIGVLMQFLLMPAIAVGLAWLLDLSRDLAIGLILVGTCPGGTASNVMTYLARGDVALSISLTTISTLLSVFMTPFLTWLLIGQMVDVPALAMLFSVLKIIILPVMLGVLVNRWLGRQLVPLQRWFPWLSVLAIVLIIGIIVALNAVQLAELVWPVVLAVSLHNLLGLGLAYWLARKLGFGPIVCRTLAIEVGMQNSGLGVALALKFFGPLSALPGAIFSIWHNISGACLAACWACGDKGREQALSPGIAPAAQYMQHNSLNKP